MKNVSSRLSRAVLALIRTLGFAVFSTIALSVFVMLRHILQSPQPLESPLPGEAHLYKWKRGYVFYKVSGDENAPALLLLHNPGIGASGYEMRKIAAALATHFRVYVPDLPGFGLSDRPNAEYTFQTYTSFCEDFLTQVVQKSAIIGASRLSCNFAVAVAAQQPSLCQGLILLSPVALFDEQVLPGRSGRVVATLAATPLKTLLYPLLVEAKAIQARLRTNRPEYSSAIGEEEMAERSYFYATTHQFGAEHAPMALLAGKLVQSVSEEIEQVQQPTLIIWGTRALHAARFADDQNDVSWAPPHSSVVLLSNARVAVQEERPEAVVQTIEQWNAGNKKLEVSPAPEQIAEPHAEKGSTNTKNHTKSEEANSGEEENVTSASVIEAYCVRCKRKTPMLNPRQVTMKNGRLDVQGTCSVCGASLHRMGNLPPGFPNLPV